MKTKKRLLPALVVAAVTAISAPTQAAQFSGVYVFGDSLSDAGYYRPFLTSLGLPPPVVSQLGRFTTNPGPVWSEIVSQYYGVTPSPSNANNGNIFHHDEGRQHLHQEGDTHQPHREQPPRTATRLRGVQQRGGREQQYQQQGTVDVVGAIDRDQHRRHREQQCREQCGGYTRPLSQHRVQQRHARGACESLRKQ
jgi:hypothetical protein